MKLIVGINKITLDEKDKLNAGEYNIHEVTFEFDGVYDELIKKAVFSNTEHSYLIEIVNNKAIIPYEVLGKTGDIGIGAFGYAVNGGDKLELRYSPSPVYVHVDLGSYKDSYDNYSVPTADVIEQLTRQIEQASQEIQEAIATIDSYDDRIDTNASDIANLNNDLNNISSQVDNNTNDISSLTTKVNINESDINELKTNKADKSEIPTKTSDLTNDNGFITKSVNDLDNYTKTSDLSTVAISGNYNDLSNKPTIPDVSSFIDKDVNNLTNYTLKTSTGSLINLSIDETNYIVTLQLKDIDGNVISTDTIDLPLESVVVSGRYDNDTKKVILTLENGSEVDFSVANLVAGLQTEITINNKLDSDLIDDSNSGNKFTNASEKQTWNNKYDKPISGIPKTDLASSVQDSLDLADTALQNETDPVFSSSASAGITSQDITNWNNKVDKITMANRVYGTNSNGEPHSWGIANASNVGNALAKYDVVGRLKASTPSADDDVTNKQYVDNAISTIDLTNYATIQYVDDLVGDIATTLDTIQREVI